MAEIRNRILNTGLSELALALARGDKIKIGRARIGTLINFEPTGDMTGPLPATIYTIGPENIFTKVIGTSKNQIRFSVTLTEDMGDFNVGNVCLDLLVNGVYIPFILWASDVAIPKLKFSTDTVGNRFIVSFTEEFVNFEDAIAITITTPYYSSLPSYSSELSLPDPTAALYQTFVMQLHTITRTPALGMRRSNDSRFFGFPFLQRLDQPFFGVLSGGFVGDGYAPYPGTIIWGGYFITPESDFIERIDCGSFTDTLFDATITCDPFNYVPTA